MILKILFWIVVIYMVIQLTVSLISYLIDKNDKFNKYRGDHN